MSMVTWKSKQIQKLNKGSHTPGKTKGANCQASSMDKWMAKHCRSYKHADYWRWCLRKNGTKANKEVV